MKLERKKLIKIIVAAAVFLVAALVVFVFFGHVSDTDDKTDEIKVKAKSVSNSIWLNEDIDYSGDISDNIINSLNEYCFDTVNLKSNVISESKYKVNYKKNTKYSVFKKDVTVSATKIEKITDAVSKVKASGLNAVVCVDIMNYNSVIAQIVKNSGCEGVVVYGCEKFSGKTVNKRLADITKIVSENNVAAVVYAHFKNDNNIKDIVFDKKYMSYCIMVTDKSDEELEEYIGNVNEILSDTAVSLVVDFRCDKVCNDSYYKNANELLKQVMITDKCSKLFGRSFCSLRDFIADRENSISTVVEYIKNGIDTDKALNEIAFIGLDEKKSETEDEVYKFKISCSDRYPIYINGYDYGVVENDVCDIQVNLRHGKNIITIEQNGNRIKHTVVCTKEFEGDYVTFISPSEDACYNGGETIKINAGAYFEAELYAIIGDKKIKMTSVQEQYGEYTIFSCSYKLPKSNDMKQNLGTLTIEATVGDNIKTYTAGSILVNAKNQQSTSDNQQQTLPQTSIQTPTVSVSSKNLTPYTYNSVSGKSNFVIVTKQTAETRSMEDNSSYYNPNYNCWTQGTIDYVTGESSYTNGDGDTFEMYNLSSGRRIVKDDVAFIPNGYNLPVNQMEVISSSYDNGLKIKLATTWCVPYSVNYYNLDFYAGYENKPFNIRNYTVSVVDFLFYYTSQGTGSVDVGNSEVVSKAEWINEGEYSVLRCYLKKQGGFYGYNMKYDEMGHLEISFKERGKTLSDMVIVIDPGHGGKDPGALGMNGTVYESHQTLSISTYLANYLIQNGATVYMTRTTDKTIELNDRRLMAEQVDPDLFISIHLNSSVNKNMSGTGTYYYTSFSMPLAQCIHNRLLTAYKTYCYQDNPDMLSELDDGISFYPFYVTRSEYYPSVLIETGYISNDYECAFLTDAAYQQFFAYAIYCGIADYASMR